MTEIDRGSPLRFADGVRRREERSEALYQKMKRNPAFQLVQRVDHLQVTTWDVNFKNVRPNVRAAQIPGDRMIFVFMDEPDKSDKPPPSTA